MGDGLARLLIGHITHAGVESEQTQGRRMVQAIH